MDKLERLAEILPAPRFDGYQARSLHKQGLFSPSETDCLETEILTGGEIETVKISARLLQEYLAGKISYERFTKSAFAGENHFRVLLEEGCTLKKATFETGGIDEDDDYLILEFAPDPAASVLK
jgi:hypothetical protein